MSKVIGRCVGETSLVSVSFISKEMPRVGEYVSLKYDGKNVLGMIESLVRGSVSINDQIYDPLTIEKSKQLKVMTITLKGLLRYWVISTTNFVFHEHQCLQGPEIMVADSKILKKIFNVRQVWFEAWESHNSRGCYCRS